MSVFARFPPRLQEAIVARLGWSSLRPVQEQAGEALLSGANAVILAPTAGGKTEAAVFPLLADLIQQPAQGVAALYVAPIKALLNNQADRLGLYTEMVGLRRCVWHGDTPESERRGFLSDPTELLMTTPESLEVMLISSRVETSRLFAAWRFLIIDEVHALAGTDRGAHLLSVVERLAAMSRCDVQRVGLSATVGNPETILTWLSGRSRRPRQVISPAADRQRRDLKVVLRPELAARAAAAATLARGSKSLFFCQTRAITEAVAEQMGRLGVDTLVHHSAISKEERDLAEERFQGGADACIVCTSTLELGIDVGDLDRVLQADAPATVGSFLQRMGRTGRRPGQAANTTFLCETLDAVLQATALIELARSGWVESVRIDGRCWPVLIHQVIALALAQDGVGPDAAWSLLSKVPDFQGIQRPEFDALIDWMLRGRFLRLVSGLLVVGPKTEQAFGRRHFMAIYSVFSSPQSYSVQLASGRSLGSLNQDFVDRLVDGVSCFLLSGRAWTVVQVQHEDRRVVVEPAPRGRQPTWGGYLPQFLGYELCQKMLSILTSDERYRYVSEVAMDGLEQRRSELRDLLTPGIGGIEIEREEIRWWTFAGGTINSTLRYALNALRDDWKVTTENLSLRVRGDGIDGRAFSQVLADLGREAFWQDKTLWEGIAASLPSYRLSKFQSLMPPWVEREVLASYLLEIDGAQRWLNRSVSLSSSR